MAAPRIVQHTQRLLDAVEITPNADLQAVVREVINSCDDIVEILRTLPHDYRISKSTLAEIINRHKRALEGSLEIQARVGIRKIKEIGGDE